MASDIKMFMQAKEDQEKRRIELHRALNDLDVEKLVLKYEYKLDILPSQDTPLALRLEKVLFLMEEKNGKDS